MRFSRTPLEAVSPVKKSMGWKAGWRAPKSAGDMVEQLVQVASKPSRAGIRKVLVMVSNKRRQVIIGRGLGLG